jgi:hypothetical protein
MNILNKKIKMVLVIMILLLNGCVTPGSTSELAFMTLGIVTLPIKIVAVAIAAAVGSAVGMGMMPL